MVVVSDGGHIMSMITGSNLIWRQPDSNLLWRPIVWLIRSFAVAQTIDEWSLVRILFDDLLYNFKFRLSGSVPFYLAIKKKHGKAWTGFKIFHVWTEKREQSLTEKSFAAGSRTCAAANPWSHAWEAGAHGMGDPEHVCTRHYP